MELFQFLIGIGAGAIAFIAYIVYVISIICGESKPNRTTWRIRSFMNLVLAVSYFFSGAGNTIWVPIVEFLGSFIIALLSLKYGQGGLDDKTDITCLIGACISIVLRIIFNNPVIALITNLAIDAFALIPTIKQSYLKPEDENFWAWFGTLMADTLNLFAVEKLTFAILVYPIYMLISDVIIVGILAQRKKGKLGPLFKVAKQ